LAAFSAVFADVVCFAADRLAGACLDGGAGARRASASSRGPTMTVMWLVRLRMR
jgi:hypothetical protein